MTQGRPIRASRALVETAAFYALFDAGAARRYSRVPGSHQASAR